MQPSPGELWSAQRPPLPRQMRPIISLGAGGIVGDAHLPAYRGAGFQVAGIFDIDEGKARDLAARWCIETVFPSLEAAICGAPAGAVFDLAVPAHAVLEIIEQLPPRAAVLIQKPLGENLEGARAIRAACQARNLRAAVNFQLRYAPYVLAARALLESGVIGELCNFEVRVAVDMPWHLWSFLNDSPRVEILYHSVHYLDLARSFCGDPVGVWAKTVKHPRSAHLASTRTEVILGYGDSMMAHVSTNHNHIFGPKHQQSTIEWEGTRGAIRATPGLLLDYPQGRPDALEWCALDENGAPGEWQNVLLRGSWYPDAFVGTMSALMRWVENEGERAPTNVEDAFETMALVEAAYLSSASAGWAMPQ